MNVRFLPFAVLAFCFAAGGPVRADHDRPADPLTPAARARPAVSPIPEAAIRALEQNRYFHASLILRDYMSTRRDSTPQELLIAARAEAGWGDWERVAKLLNGRSWLDSLEGGIGWNLLGRSHYEAGHWEAARRAITRFLEVGRVDDVERGLAELLRAHAAREAGDVAAALQGYDRAAVLLTDAADWVSLQAAAAASAIGDTAQVATRLARIEPELAREWGWRHRVRAFRQAGDLVGAVAAASRATAEIGAANRQAQAHVELGRIRFELGDAAGAREAFRRAIATSSGGSGGVDGARHLSEMPGITASDRLLIGRTYLRHGNTQRGIAGITAYLDAGGGSAIERERLRYELGRAWFRAGRYDQAEKTLLGIVERNTSRSLAADALFLAARSQYRDGRVTQSRRTFLDVAARYPAEDAAAQAMYLSADLDHDDGNLERAAERYRIATTLSRDVEEVGLAHMRLGGLAFQTKDWTRALAEFDGYRKSYPTGRRYVQATYWAALSSRALGQQATMTARLEEVVRLDPFSYYGGLALDRLGRSFRDIPLGPSTATDPALARDVQAALRRVDLLRRMEWQEAAGFEVDRIRLRFTASKPALYSLAEALNERGYTMTGIAIGWDLFRRDGGWNDRLLRIIYPFPHQAVILAEAAERGVDPFLAAGLIRQESMFDPAAVSPAGAMGLMQVMPATGEALARQLGLARFDPDLLKRGELNAHLGMRYLADQLQRFDSRLPVVLAAYNAGPHRIDRWQEFPEFGDDEQFAERIPFGETRDYVKIVQNNARIYRSLYGALDLGMAPAR